MLEKLPENKIHLSTETLKIIGEPIEKLFLWGQSSCVFTVGEEQRVLTFGGFGGPGRHARRNYSLLLDHKSGLLTEMIFKASPSPRMGHTVTTVGNSTYLIGGRGGPSEILDDVWILQSTGNTWSKLECCGNLFQPRYSLVENIDPPFLSRSQIFHGSSVSLYAGTDMQLLQQLQKFMYLVDSVMEAYILV